MIRKPLSHALVAAGICATVVAAYAVGEAPALHSAPARLAALDASASSQAKAAADVPAYQPATNLPDFSGLVASYGPAVVNITVTEAAKPMAAAPALPELSPDDPFSQFFRRFAVPDPQDATPTHGLGSGFIVSSDGVILTNAHVVDGAKEVTVKLTDHREFAAKVIGKDTRSDVAVIKIEASGLPTVRLGSAAKVRVGEWVAAIGSPFGFENTVTSGIVSAKARRLPNENYVPFLQTDVPVNPGNSGGPLFDMQGEVIGINSQIYSRTGGFQGLSFAVPIDLAVQVKDQLLATGHVTRGRLGAAIQDVNQSLADSFRLARPAGALVASVEAHSPAERAGLKAGDVILSLNGNPITQSGDLPSQVAAMAPGSRAEIAIWRDGHQRTLVATLDALPDEKLAANDGAAVPHGKLGLQLHAVTPDESGSGTPPHGLVVDAASGPAAAAGIQAGDVILSCNGTPVSSVEQLRQIVAKAGKHVALLVQHDDARIFVPIELG